MTEGATQSGLNIRSRKYYILLIYCAIVGVLGALVAVAFGFLLKYGIGFVWVYMPGQLGLGHGTDSAFFILAACLLGGLIVGLITHFTKVRPALFVEELDEFGETGRIVPRNGAVGMVRGFFGLMFGGSMGPEGPLMGGSGALGTWLAERLKLRREVVSLSTSPE